jgi:hypothetical protein
LPNNIYAICESCVQKIVKETKNTPLCYPSFCPRRNNPDYAIYLCSRHEQLAMETQDYWSSQCPECIRRNVNGEIKP